MKIAPATGADIPIIRSIAHATWEISYRGILPPGQMAHMLEMMYAESALLRQMADGHRFIIAEKDGHPSGFASMEHRHFGSGRTRMHKLYVHPDAQRSGVGRALLQAVETAALAAGDTHVELNVNKRNPARAFYERHGYTVLRDEVIDIGQGFVMDDHVMALRLTERPHIGTSNLGHTEPLPCGGPGP